MWIDNLFTNQCILSHLLVLLFSLVKLILYSAPVIGVPYVAEETIHCAKVIVLVDAVFKKREE